jgi:hypothetical protein
MDPKSEVIHTETIERAGGSPAAPHATAFEAPVEHVKEYQEADHIRLGWRSWIVVFVTCFAIMAQVFVVVAAGSVIAFIIRDLGNASIAGWIIRKPFRNSN